MIPRIIHRKSGIFTILFRMKTKIPDRLKSLTFHLDRNIITYGICVLIASILWFLNALNKEYTSEISYPVKYTDFPKGKYLVSELPSSIQLEVRAKGFALLGHHIRTSFLPIIFNLNSYNNHLQKKGHIYEFTLHLNEIKEKISSQLNSEIKLLSVKPESIEFRFSQAANRKVPICPSVHYTLKSQHILKEAIRCTPDSIVISGPKARIDTLKCVHTETWDAGEIKKDRDRTLKLCPISGITFDEINVTVYIQIERFTEAQRTIPIHILHLPDSLDIKLFPASVEISYEIGLSKYDRITDRDFRAVTDFQKYDRTSSFLPVEVIKFPPFIKDLKITPQKVEYILEKK